MKRSEVNACMKRALTLCEDHHFRLPPFAFWSPDIWRGRGLESAGIIRQQLGWDITDFGSGDFEREGLILFTIRNGVFAEVKANPLLARSYAEKLLIADEDQVTPIHFHHFKTEDIINRGGGTLVVQLWNSTEDEELATSDVEIVCDGVVSRVAAGDTIELHPGESVTLPRLLYHKFWARRGGGPVLAGEVSRVCDEYSDNRFLSAPDRFADIEEDQDPLHLLFCDYQRYYRYFDQVSIQ